MNFRISKIYPNYVFSECKIKSELDDDVVLKCPFCKKDISCVMSENINCSGCDDVNIVYVGEYISVKKFNDSIEALAFVTLNELN